MSRKYNVKEIHLRVDDIKGCSNEVFNGFTIYWSSDIGFGEYTIGKEPKDDDGKLYADSEYMDSNDDKEFISELMRLLVKKLVVTG